MARLLIPTALMGLLLSAGAALAQPDPNDHNRGHRGGNPPAANAAAPAPAAQPAAPPAGRPGAPPQQNRDFSVFTRGAAPPAAPPAQQAPQNAMRGPDRGNNDMRNRDNRGSFDNRGQDNRDFSRDNRGQDNRGFNRDYRGQDNRGYSRDYRGQDRNNFASHQRNFSSPHRFRAPAYHRPRGWYDHRWTFGEILPSLFWAPDYWLNDYYDYGLMPPPAGTVWVRDGYDALLIDRYNGEIIQVDYDVFY